MRPAKVNNLPALFRTLGNATCAPKGTTGRHFKQKLTLRWLKLYCAIFSWAISCSRFVVSALEGQYIHFRQMRVLYGCSFDTLGLHWPVCIALPR